MLMTWSSILVMRSPAVLVRSQPTSLEIIAVPLMNSLALMLYLKLPPVSLYLDLGHHGLDVGVYGIDVILLVILETADLDEQHVPLPACGDQFEDIILRDYTDEFLALHDREGGEAVLDHDVDSLCHIRIP